MCLLWVVIACLAARSTMRWAKRLIKLQSFSAWLSGALLLPRPPLTDGPIAGRSRPMTDRPGLDFSFSGLKTFTRNTVPQGDLDEQTVADIACAFQEAAVDTLVIKCKRALEQTGRKRLVIAGGVGANVLLRERLKAMTEASGRGFYPRPQFCTDNGAMIAYAGSVRLSAGQQQGLDFSVRPRWRLTDLPPIESAKD